MLSPSYTFPDEHAIARAMDRLLVAARRRRLQLDATCDPAEASRRDVAAAAVALVAAAAILAAEARS